MSNEKNIVVIKVENSYSTLETKDTAIINMIDEHLAYLTPGYFFVQSYKNGYWDGKQRFFNKHTKQFPTGLLASVISTLADMNEKYKLVDNRLNSDCALDTKAQKVIELYDSTLRDYQVDSYNSVATNTLNGLVFQRGVINLATNAGKTIIAEAILRDLLEKIPEGKTLLFLTHSKEIASQTKKSMEDNLQLDIGLAGCGRWDIKPITIAMVSTLYSKYKRKDKRFTDLKNSVVGFIADECHHSSSNSWMEVIQQLDGAYVRLGLTGTVKSNATEKASDALANNLKVAKLYSITGDILSKVSNNYLIEHKYSAKPECYLIPIEYPELADRVYTGTKTYLSYQDIYQEGIVANSYRNYIIAMLSKKLVEQKKQVLILVERLEHGMYILQDIQKEAPNVNVIFLHGELSMEERADGLEQLKLGEVDVVISTAILDEGISVPNIGALIYARGMKSTRKLLQAIGRGLRKKEDGSTVKVYDFIDYTGAEILSHSLARYKTLKKEKFEVKKLNAEKALNISKSKRLELIRDNGLDSYTEKFMR